MVALPILSAGDLSRTRRVREIRFPPGAVDRQDLKPLKKSVRMTFVEVSIYTSGVLVF
jgi:hypothetical protein